MRPMQAPTMKVRQTIAAARSNPYGIAVMMSKRPAGCCSTALYVPATTRFCVPWAVSTTARSYCPAGTMYVSTAMKRMKMPRMM